MTGLIAVVRRARSEMPRADGAATGGDDGPWEPVRHARDVTDSSRPPRACQWPTCAVATRWTAVFTGRSAVDSEPTADDGVSDPLAAQRFAVATGQGALPTDPTAVDAESAAVDAAQVVLARENRIPGRFNYGRGRGDRIGGARKCRWSGVWAFGGRVERGSPRWPVRSYLWDRTGPTCEHARPDLRPRVAPPPRSLARLPARLRSRPAADQVGAEQSAVLVERSESTLRSPHRISTLLRWSTNSDASSLGLTAPATTSAGINSTPVMAQHGHLRVKSAEGNVRVLVIAILDVPHPGGHWKRDFDA
jgi:hypothetical protein